MYIEEKLDRILAILEGKQTTFAPPAPSATATATTPPTTAASTAAPAPPSAPVATAAPAPTAPPPATPIASTPAPTPAAPSAPPAPPAPATATNIDPEKDAFHKTVQDKLKALGEHGKPTLDKLNAKFGIAALRELDAVNRDSFLQWCDHAVAGGAIS